jgi:hypothetical protein
MGAVVDPKQPSASCFFRWRVCSDYRVANVLIRITLRLRASSPDIKVKEAPNGLESAENRRSVGRHGNQHVYVRYPQVSGDAN